MDRVTHFEVPANDVERAKKFYSDIFGWKLADAGIEGWDYTIIHTGPTDEKNMLKEAGVINGGMFKRKTNKDQQTFVIQVDSIDDRLEQVEKHGGRTIAPKSDVGDMGYYAQFVDTEGNLVGVWQDKKKPS